jgi:hypothetical protein
VVDVAEVGARDARSDSEVDDEMRDQVARMPFTPVILLVRGAIERLGTIAAGITQENAEPALPDWLVQALVRVVGMPHTEVDTLSEPDAQRISRNGSQND